MIAQPEIGHREPFALRLLAQGRPAAF
jgi:hypothetical protein